MPIIQLYNEKAIGNLVVYPPTHLTQHMLYFPHRLEKAKFKDLGDWHEQRPMLTSGGWEQVPNATSKNAGALIVKQEAVVSQ